MHSYIQNYMYVSLRIQGHRKTCNVQAQIYICVNINLAVKWMENKPGKGQSSCFFLSL